MRIVFISDTHRQHHDVDVPSGDLLIHAGDVSSRGRESEIENFLDWFSNQKHQYKVFIAGNHDFFFEQESVAAVNAKIPSNVIYLNDSGLEIEGFKIWGSPVQPEFFDWAFNRKRGSEIKAHWDLIPKDTDILITHGPPSKILDRTAGGEYVGCQDLLEQVKLVKPKVHVFGHIHEGYGVLEQDGTTYINASVLDEHYRMRNDPVVVDL